MAESRISTITVLTSLSFNNTEAVVGDTTADTHSGRVWGASYAPSRKKYTFERKYTFVQKYT
jgi:hypothetical protein